MSVRRTVIAVAAVIGLVAAASVAPAAAAPAPWTAQPVAAVSEPGGVLTSVDCYTATNCFAVGTISTPAGTTIPLAQQWDGTSWTRVVVSAPAGAVSARLDSVECDYGPCLAVGRWQPNAASTNTRPFTLKYNTVGFAPQPVPPAPGFPSSSLSAVACHGPYCVAVGRASNPTTVQPVAMQWHYSPCCPDFWSVLPTPPSGPANSSQLAGIDCPADKDCFAVGDDAGHSLAERWNGTAFTRLATPDIGALGSVSCAGPTFCVAVARRDDTTGPPTGALLWNGTTWTAVTTPRSNPSYVDDLRSVSCASTTDCTAVGVTSRPGVGVAVSLAEHWDGTAWSMDSVPQQGPTSNNVLAGVSCKAGTCTAVGRYATTGFATPSDLVTEVGARPLAATRTAAGWTLPAIAGYKTTRTGAFADVSCATTTLCAAVGTQGATTTPSGLLEMWDGSTWAVAATPAGTAGLTAVSCPAATSCLAAGTKTTATGRAPLFLRYSGASWTAVALPPTVNGLSTLACDTATSCTSLSPSRTTAFHWNGTTWTATALPALRSTVTATSFTGLSCTSATDCVAVGSYTEAGTIRPLVFVRTTTGWRWDDGVGVAGNHVAFAGVSCVSATSCTAAGSVVTDASSAAPLIETWDGTTWTPATTPALSGYSTLADVSCQSATSCAAVGRTGTAGVDPLVETWDGTAWTQVTAQRPPGSVGSVTLTAVSCAAGNCESVGVNRISAVNPELAAALRPVVIAGGAA